MRQTSGPAGDDTSDTTTSDDLELDPETVEDLDIEEDADVQGGRYCSVTIATGTCNC